MRAVVDISAYWPRDADGQPKSVNSVWEESKAIEKIGRNTLSAAIGGNLDRGHLANFVRLATLCSHWSGRKVSINDIVKIVRE